jgi:hypothetical protein
MPHPDPFQLGRHFRLAPCEAWSRAAPTVNPPPVEQIAEAVGALPVPVGYAAVPAAAVWFFDTAMNTANIPDPQESGLVVLVSADGDVVRFAVPDAPAAELRTSIGALH